MNKTEQFNSGVEEIFSNWSKDPCLTKPCKDTCPVGFTCIRAMPPRSGEFRLDFFNCNIKCPFCWTIDKPQSWNSNQILARVVCKFDTFRKADLGVTINYLRVTGGEPLMTPERVAFLLEVFGLIDSDLKNNPSRYDGIWEERRAPLNIAGRRNIKIQTNGLTLASLVEQILSGITKTKKLAFTFEISLKGTSPAEFEILSGGRPADHYEGQLQALRSLISYEKQGFPIFVRGIIGIFHSDQHDLTFPSGERMMQKPSADFIQVANMLWALPRKQERFYVEPLRFTDHMPKAQNHCKEKGILGISQLGKNIKAGKKIQVSKTYLANLLK